MQFRVTLDYGQGGDDSFNASSVKEAIRIAQEWALEGDWGNDPDDVYTHIRLYLITDDEDILVHSEHLLVHSAEDGYAPPCVDGLDHVWRSDFDVVGGIRENPGFWSLGGLAYQIKENCRACGLICVTTGDNQTIPPKAHMEYIQGDEPHVEDSAAN